MNDHADSLSSSDLDSLADKLDGFGATLSTNEQAMLALIIASDIPDDEAGTDGGRGFSSQVKRLYAAPLGKSNIKVTRRDGSLHLEGDTSHFVSVGSAFTARPW